MIDTGKVLIGLRHEPRYIEQGAHALMLQRLLTTALPPKPAWAPAPPPIELKPGLRRRVAMILRGFR